MTRQSVKEEALQSHINVRAGTYAPPNVNPWKIYLRSLILKEKKLRAIKGRGRVRFERKDSRETERERETRSFGTRHGPSGRTIFYYGIYSSRGLSSNDEEFIRAEVGSLINGRRDKPHRFPDRYRRREAVSWLLLPQLIFARNFALRQCRFLKLYHI